MTGWDGAIPPARLRDGLVASHLVGVAFADELVPDRGRRIPLEPQQHDKELSGVQLELFRVCERTCMRATIRPLAERSPAGYPSVAVGFEKVEQAARFPRSGAALAGFEPRHDVRKHAVRRFRDVVITALVDETLTVVAVAPTSREPGYWRDRLG